MNSSALLKIACSPLGNTQKRKKSLRSPDIMCKNVLGPMIFVLGTIIPVIMKVRHFSVKIDPPSRGLEFHFFF